MNKEETKKFQMEYIGKKAKIKIHNQSFEGKIIDETKNTITVLDQNNKEKMIIKKQITFTIGDKVVEGKSITKRSEERIKK